jgi:hypothetical protein
MLTNDYPTPYSYNRNDRDYCDRCSKVRRVHRDWYIFPPRWRTIHRSRLLPIALIIIPRLHRQALPNLRHLLLRRCSPHHHYCHNECHKVRYGFENRQTPCTRLPLVSTFQIVSWRRGKAHLHGTQLPKIYETVHFCIYRICLIRASKPPKRILRLRHLVCSSCHCPQHNVQTSHRIHHDRSNRTGSVRRADAARIRDERDQVHEERYSGYTEQHEGGPEVGGGDPGMASIAGDDFVLGEEVFRKCVREDPNHPGVDN